MLVLVWHIIVSCGHRITVRVMAILWPRYIVVYG